MIATHAQTHGDMGRFISIIDHANASAANTSKEDLSGARVIHVERPVGHAWICYVLSCL